jgi:hypothetical protein
VSLGSDETSAVSPSGEMTALRRPPQRAHRATGPSRSIRAEILGSEGSPVSSTSSLGYCFPEVLQVLKVFTKRANDGSLDFRKSKRPVGAVWATAGVPMANRNASETTTGDCVFDLGSNIFIDSPSCPLAHISAKGRIQPGPWSAEIGVRKGGLTVRSGRNILKLLEIYG